MSKSEGDKALDEIMQLIRQPAKEAQQTQAQYLLELVQLGLEMKNLQVAKQQNQGVSESQKH